MSENRKRLLLVDDNKQFCELIRNAFCDELEITAVQEGEAGLASAAECRPDIVLLDVNMPSVNGIEFLRRMEQSPGLAGIPVLVITASFYNRSTESLARRYVNVADFITKLVPLETIREKIFKALSGAKGG